MSTTHVPWDRGVVTIDAAATLASDYGLYLQQQTCKTYCGQRVAMSAIDNDTPTCVECRTLLVQHARRNREGFIEAINSPLAEGNDPESVEYRDKLTQAIEHCENDLRRFG